MLACAAVRQCGSAVVCAHQQENHKNHIIFITSMCRLYGESAANRCKTSCLGHISTSTLILTLPVPNHPDRSDPQDTTIIDTALLLAGT